MATPAGPSFDSVLDFTKNFRDQYSSLLDSIQYEAVPILIKENWKKKNGKTVSDYAEYVAHRIRAEAGLSEELKNALVDAINPAFIESLYDEMKPKKGAQKKRIRQVRVNRTTYETFIILNQEDGGSDDEDEDDDAAGAEDANQEFFQFKLVFAEKRQDDNDRVYKFRLRGTLYRRILDQGLYNTLSQVYHSLPRA